MSNMKALDNRVKALRRRLPAAPGEYMTFEEWEYIQQIIYEALKPFTDARVAVAAALMAAEGKEKLSNS